METFEKEWLALPASLFFISFLPLLQTQLQQLLKPIITKQAQNGLSTIIYLQHFRTPTLTSIVDLSALTVSVPFYATFIPLLLYIGHVELTVCLSAMLATQQYCGSFLKDLICGPRPMMIDDPDSKSKLAYLRKTLSNIDSSYSKEYGFPSTHVSQSISLNLFLIWYFHQNTAFNTQQALLYGVSIVWSVWIAFGRMFSCMHTPIDVLGGTILGTLLFIAGTTFCQSYLLWLVNAKNLYLYQVLVVMVLTLIYPQPAKYTPSFNDAVSFFGAWYGISVSFWLARDFLASQITLYIRWLGVVQVLGRLVIGLPIGLVVKEGSKKLVNFVLSSVVQMIVRIFEIKVEKLNFVRTISATTTRFISYVMYAFVLYIGVPYLEYRLITSVGL